MALNEEEYEEDIKDDVIINNPLRKSKKIKEDKKEIKKEDKKKKDEESEEDNLSYDTDEQEEENKNLLHKIRREKEKEINIEKSKEIKDEKDITYGHKIHWKKILLIKEGENSYIYKAFNVSNGHVFIVKEYKKNAIRLFYREAKCLKKNKHKNIVGFIDAEVVNDDNNNNYLKQCQTQSKIF